MRNFMARDYIGAFVYLGLNESDIDRPETFSARSLQIRPVH